MIKIFLFVLTYLFGNMPEEIIAQHDYLSFGVVDRVEGEIAIILLEDEEKEIRIPMKRQIEEDKWLLIYWNNNQPHFLWSLDNYKKERQENSQTLIEKLHQKNSYLP